MAYSLTYLMMAGPGLRMSNTAGDAVHDHAALLAAGASSIVIRDARLLVVTLATVTAAEKPNAHRV